MNKAKKVVFKEFIQRTHYAISPFFGFTMLFFLWVGTFAISFMNSDITIAKRILMSSILPIPLLFVGFYLFQSYLLHITNETVLWQSVIIPRLWKEKWQEPLSNYSSVKLIKTKPIPGSGSLKFYPYLIHYPIRITSNRKLGKEAQIYNNSSFIMVILEHKTDKDKNISLGKFKPDEKERLKKFCNQICQDLDLPISTFS